MVVGLGIALALALPRLFVLGAIGIAAVVIGVDSSYVTERPWLVVQTSAGTLLSSTAAVLYSTGVSAAIHTSRPALAVVRRQPSRTLQVDDDTGFHSLDHSAIALSAGEEANPRNYHDMRGQQQRVQRAIGKMAKPLEPYVSFCWHHPHERHHDGEDTAHGLNNVGKEGHANSGDHESTCTDDPLPRRPAREQAKRDTT